jgi:hypothetical protein
MAPAFFTPSAHTLPGSSHSLEVSIGGLHVFGNHLPWQRPDTKGVDKCIEMFKPYVEITLERENQKQQSNVGKQFLDYDKLRPRDLNDTCTNTQTCTRNIQMLGALLGGMVAKKADAPTSRSDAVFSFATSGLDDDASESQSGLETLHFMLQDRAPSVLAKVQVHNRLPRFAFGIDSLIGEATMKINLEKSAEDRLAGYGSSATGMSVDLTHQGCKIGTLMLDYRVHDIAQAVGILASPSKPSLARIVDAVACVLTSPSSIDLLMELRPPAMVGEKPDSRQHWRPSKRKEQRLQQEKARSEVSKLVEAFIEQRPLAVNALSTDDALRHLAPVARSVLQYVARMAGKDEQALPLSIAWLERFFARMRSAAPTTTGEEPCALDAEKLRLFFTAASPRLRDVKPIDSEGKEESGWEVKRNFEGSCSKLPRQSLLGYGSYAVVWRAKDQHTGKTCAVKTFQRQGYGLMEVPQWECNIASHIMKRPHPNVIRLHNVFANVSMCSFSIVMELCPGGDLRDRIVSERNAAQQSNIGYQAPAQSLKWLGQVLLGLEHLHLKLEMLHLDIKLENVVFDSEDNAKLTDFGFSHLGKRSEGAFAFGAPPGSPEYVAPEVLLKRPFGYSADLYSYGVMMWVVMSGGISYSQRHCNPPCVDWQFPDTEPLLGNWRKLEDAVRDPVAHDAPPVSNEEAQDLILKLTYRGEDWSELSHDEIWQHVFFEKLQLPEARVSHMSLDCAA